MFQAGNTFGKGSKGNRSNTGKHFSDAHKRKISLALRGKKASKESRKKMSVSHTGKKLSTETRKKMSAHAGNNKGKRWKVSDTSNMKGKRGEEHYSWLKDRTQLKKYSDPAKARRCSAYTEWRKQVWLRDNYTCKIANPDCAGRIEAHHILSFTEFVELRYNINNGITLCHFHHPRKRADEIKLSPYFQELVKNIK